ncbi:MAG: 2-hydroxyglutaryl-CoA dehydratase [Clostridium sp.]|nr:2-hydroxyglutaryl-CoA dehydratase [Clostridium sp.]
MIYTLGIDIGSTTSKCVILSDRKEILSMTLLKGGAGTRSPLKAYNLALKEAGLSEEDLSYVISTGYGRSNFSQSMEQVSELSCHAKGVYFSEPETRTIIDIGGQDVKVIALDKNGKMSNFLMNDKCAAGTGRFLDVMAGILAIDVQELEEYAESAKNPVSISNTCTVFAESEVISQMSRGVELEDLVAGICESVARRVAGLAKRIGIKDGVFMSGGVAQNGGVRHSLESILEKDIIYNDKAQYMGALGASLFAYDKFINNKKGGY